jgi:hypothetical protein
MRTRSDIHVPRSTLRVDCDVRTGRSTTIGVVTAYWGERAWFSSGVTDRVLVSADDAGVVTSLLHS